MPDSAFKLYHIRIRDNPNINWRRLLGLVALLGETTKTEVVKQALGSYCEGRLDEAINSNPHLFSFFSKQELEKELVKLRAFIEEET